MLHIIVPENEFYDEDNNLFIYTKETELVLEHSLASISKWESKWKKPFLSNNKTRVEFLDYVRCMSINDIDEMVYRSITDSILKKIQDYIESNETATWFRKETNKSISREIITSEVIYYWMFSLGIPSECENWHLNRLLTLIRVFNAKNTPQKKRSMNEILRSNRELNEQRKKAWNTKG